MANYSRKPLFFITILVALSTISALETSKPKANIGDPCVEGSECYDYDAICLNSKCYRCTSIEVPNIIKDTCLPIVPNVGEACVEGQQCSSPNSACLDPNDAGGETVCTDCGEDSLPNSFRDGCVPYATQLGDSCADQPMSQCSKITDAICAFGVCECLFGYVPNGNNSQCLLPGSDGTQCASFEDCTYPNSVCTDGWGNGVNVCKICGTNEFSNAARDKCVGYSRYNESCADEPQRQCDKIRNSECSDDLQICQCLAGYIPVDGYEPQCLPVNVLQCSSGLDCWDANTACFDADEDGVKTCNVCDVNQFPNAEKSQCLEYGVVVGDTCQDQIEQCRNVENTVCTDDQCLCLPGYEPSADNTGCFPPMKH